ncbi:OmpA family protein [Rhodopila sp.]|uniref:OmpA family protein n=1 Tax=Rhodopila sp. TaxID=2480087 RepID=UPI003D0993DB
MKFRNALLAATVLALPVAAKAQPITGLYIGGGGGVNIMHDETAKVAAGGFGAGGHLQTRVGPAADLDIGYGLGNGLRVELEGTYRYNTIKGLSGTANAGGQEQKFGPMINVIYGLDGLFPSLPVQPYVGVGGGYIWTQERNLHASGPGFASTAGTRTDGSIAYQAILGAAVPIETVPGLALTADYRFLGLVDHRNYPGQVNGVPGKIRLDDDFNHTILIGLRYNFGVAPPPAAPVAAPVPASPVSRSYLVFFDWDKATLTDRARQIVSEAAANSTKVQYTQLEVNGYTDTSGTARYNQGLSVRRANAVAGELVKDGVPKSAIEIQGFGETHLLVPTGQGVREPQNRRVEIIIK